MRQRLSHHHITRQIVEALRSGKSGGIADLIEPAKPRGAPVGNQNAAKGKENKDANSTIVSPKTKGSTKSETIIARLKRDAATYPQAEAMLAASRPGTYDPIANRWRCAILSM